MGKSDGPWLCWLGVNHLSGGRVACSEGVGAFEQLHCSFEGEKKSDNPTSLRLHADRLQNPACPDN